MDRDQSIEFARVLNREYQSANELDSRITDCEERLAKPFNAAIEERNIFYYFKPFLKASVITTLIMLVPTYFWASIAEFLAQERGDHTHYAFKVAFLFPAGVFILICAIGFIVAKAKLKRFMESEDNRVRADLKRRESIRAELNELQQRLADQTSGLDEYNALVPPQLRTQRHMKQVENLLLTNKADSFEEAIANINKQEGM